MPEVGMKCAIVTSQQWRAEELRAAGLDVEHCWPWDALPTPRPAWSPITRRYVELLGHDLPGRETVDRMAHLLYAPLVREVLLGDALVFAKPVDYKPWPAGVMPYGAVPRGALVHVAMAPPVCEWRVWHDGSEVVAAAEYRRDGVSYPAAAESWEHRALSPDALRFVTRAGQLVLDRPMVLDIGQHSDGSWGVIEANCPTTSDWYGLSPEELRAVVERTWRRQT